MNTATTRTNPAQEWETLQRQWNGKGSMLLDAIRQKINTEDDPVILHFWKCKYEVVHEEVIQCTMRFQLR